MDSVNNLRYILNLANFALKKNKLLYLSISISIISVAIELIALSSLLPLLALISESNSQPHGIIIEALTFLNIKVSASNLLKLFTVLLLVRIITQLFAQSLSAYLGRRVMSQLASSAFDKIMNHLPLKEIEEKSIGYFINLAGDESFRASTIVISLTQIVSTSFLSLLYFLAIVNFSINMSLSVIGFMLLVAIALITVFKTTHKYGERQIEESRSATSVFLDSLNNIKTVRALLSEKYVTNLYKTKIFKYSKTLFQLDQVSLLSRTIPIIILLVLLGLYQLVFNPSLNNKDISFIVTIIVYMMRFFPTVGQCLNLLMKLISDARIGRDITQLIDSTENQASTSVELISSIEQIRFQDVSFSYTKNPKKRVLHNINLNFDKGKSYALSGKSGLGKSTLTDLILKFHKPTDGFILINQHEISNLNTELLRKKIILVNQEPAIFDDTIQSNISMGLDFSNDEIQQACEQASIADIIELMPDKYNSRLQYQGKNLSGGQRQRIAIARALIRNPEVLIFDESTSALDKVTQGKILQNILQKKSDKIIIFITHDPEIMELVDEVINLEKLNVETSHT